MNALLAYVYESDRRVDGRVRRWVPPAWFRVWMRTSSAFADRWLWPWAALTLAAGGEAAHRAMAASALAAAAANLVLVVLKRRFRRPRPCDVSPYPLYVDVRPLDDFSFPSGHSMNAFAVGTVVSLAFPSAAPGIGLLAASIAASRVVLGMHYVSDVIAGSLLGALAGGAAYAFVLARLA